MPRDGLEGTVRRTNVQDRYEVTIDSSDVEAVLEANIALGREVLDAAIAEYRSAISFERLRHFPLTAQRPAILPPQEW